MRTCNSELVEEVMVNNGEAHELKEALEVERHRIPEYRKKAIIDYKASVSFKKGLERTRVTSYQFRYQFALARFKARYPTLDLEEDTFMDYPKDQNISTPIKMPFNESLGSLPHPIA
ncbi:hypothetical protein BHM03_00006209 [Ensete ventricosum]|nr:hypothetical protein BHM03_00006209 [Ensete ventricosum]